MNITECISAIRKIQDFISKLDEHELYEKIESLGISEERRNILLGIIKEPINNGLSAHDAFDVLLYVVKKIFPEQLPAHEVKQHLLSSNESYEYDPAKNGQNIIKHGLSFSEVVSYSKDFGSLIVPCPDKDDSKRVVIFSNLYHLKKGYTLKLPINNNDHGNDTVISIAESKTFKFRFISSRIMSSRRHFRTLDNALKNIYPNEPEKKEQFIKRCIEILKANRLIDEA